MWSGFAPDQSGKDRALTRDDRVHGALLVLNELLRCSNNQWERLVMQLKHLTHYQTTVQKKVR